MSKNIWSGKEPFLKGHKLRKKLDELKLPHVAVFLILIMFIVILVLLLIDSFDKDIESNEKDDLEQYRNMTAEEILNQMYGDRPIPHPLKEIELSSGEYYFEPREIKVKLNDRVKMNIYSTNINYTLIIPSFFIIDKIKEDDRRTIEFIANKQGEFTFRAKEFDNMEGVIVVE